MLRNPVALFSFANHAPGWLEEIGKHARPEPWGANLKILELYVRANFEIAKLQGKVYVDDDKGIAFWRAGHLVNTTSDPLWIEYRKNRRVGKQPWDFNRILTGNSPEGKSTSDLTVRYDPPDFEPSWPIAFEQQGIGHIIDDNRERIESVFKDVLKHYNAHLAFRAIYGEIQLKWKEGLVIPQWYHGDFHFIMPLFLTRPNRVELTAAIMRDPALKRYVVRTLLMPHYAYAYARAVVKSRASFADWMMLSEEQLKAPDLPEEDGQA